SLVKEVEGSALSAEGLAPGRYRAEVTRPSATAAESRPALVHDFSLSGGARAKVAVVLTDTTGVKWTVAGFAIAGAAVGVAYLIVRYVIFRGFGSCRMADSEDSGRTRVELELGR